MSATRVRVQKHLVGRMLAIRSELVGQERGYDVTVSDVLDCVIDTLAETNGPEMDPDAGNSMLSLRSFSPVWTWGGKRG